jgi:hypothetical protein
MVPGRVAQRGTAGSDARGGRRDQGAGIIRAVTAEAVGVLPQDDATPVVGEGVALDEGVVADLVDQRLGVVGGEIVEYTVCTAIAPEAVFTVRTYATRRD